MIDTDMLIFLAIKGEGAKGKNLITKKVASYHKIAKLKFTKESRNAILKNSYRKNCH